MAIIVICYKPTGHIYISAGPFQCHPKPIEYVHLTWFMVHCLSFGHISLLLHCILDNILHRAHIHTDYTHVSMNSTCCFLHKVLFLPLCIRIYLPIYNILFCLQDKCILHLLPFQICFVWDFFLFKDVEFCVPIKRNFIHQST